MGLWPFSGDQHRGPVPLSVQKHPSKFSRTFAKWTDFNVLSIFEPKPPPAVPRNVLVNVPIPYEAWEPTKKGKKQLEQGDDPSTIERQVGQTPTINWLFSSNQVLTSKYNIITFLPRNLLEQFRRVANIFFLVLVILQFFPRFSNVSPALAALPLIIVLAITAIKDGYEDLKRHQSDRKINNIKVHVLAGGSYENNNITASKERTISLRWMAKPFQFFKFRKRSHPTTNGKEELEMQSVTPPDEPEDRFTGDMNNRGSWWGTRLRKIKKPQQQQQNNSSKMSSSPSHHNVSTPIQESTAEDVESDDDSDQESEIQSEFDDDEYQQEPQQQQQQQQQQTNNINNKVSNLPHDILSMDPQSKPKWRKAVWEDLKVGDFVRLRNNDSIPADILVCSSSEEENVCYVETKNLDGETNLKTRTAIPELTNLKSAGNCSQGKFVVSSEAPDVSMNKYSASVELHDGTLGKDGKPMRVPVNLNNMLLRGCVVRNTEWVIGLVVFTGRDTKIVLNSGGTPSKRSKVERQMNPQVFVNLALLAIMCSMCAIGDHFSEVYYSKRDAPWQFGDNLNDDNPNINGIITFANGMIAFQNIVPISLYISIEFIRLVQAFYIWADDEIKYRPVGAPGRRAFARSWNLSDDLGQIEYIFSDKTGTLTQNSMQFRRCTIDGKVYRGQDVPDHETDSTLRGPQDLGTKASSSSSPPSQIDEKIGADDIIAADQYHQQNVQTTAHIQGLNPTDPTATAAGKDGGGGGKKQAVESVEPFTDRELESDMKYSESSRRERIRQFFINLSLCHTVLASETEDGIEYKAQSPDEAALVQGAADAGYVFRGRDKNILKLQLPDRDDLVEYELLNVLEFTSARKRMSVVVRKLPDPNEEELGDEDAKQDLLLLSKGADNIIFERLAPGADDDLKETTDSHLELFASEGLRTLTLAYRNLPAEEYDAWEAEYHEAETLIDGREDAIERASDKLERNLRLLGATAIEDKLQDGVPDAIGDLKRAGIKIWVATGDKLETAIAIGMSSNLLSRDMNLIIIRGGAHGEKNSVYEQMRKAIIQFFPEGAEIVPQLENQPPGADPATPRRSSLMMGRRSASYGGGPRSSRQLQRTQTGLSGISDLVDPDNGKKPGGYGLVIEGSSLTHAFEEPYSKDLLLELATRCDAVVCCRTSPLQKALIVRLVRDGLNAMCLAIGDGANDVSMIQAADVGVGVAGEEGMQAVNASDYAIGQFRFLSRLLLLHGHWDYVRNSNLIMNFWEKEIIGIGILFWFQFYCLYSTTTVYEYTYLLFWNVFWTIAPVLAIGLFERHVPENALLQVPELYRYGRERTYFGLWRFFWYMMDGTYQSIVCFFFIYYYYDITSARTDGLDVEIYEMSTVMAISAVWVSSTYIALNSYALTWWLFAFCILGPILIVLYTVVYSAIKPGWIWTRVYGNNDILFTAAPFWFGWILTFFIALAPRYLVRYYKTSYAPNDIDIIRYVAKFKPFHNFADDKSIHGGARQTTSMSSSQAPVNDPFYDNRLSFATTDSAAGVTAHDREQQEQESQQQEQQQQQQSRKWRKNGNLGHLRSPTVGSTTDMSTGLTQTTSRGYAFDQADGIGEVAVGRPLRRYTSSLHGDQQPQKGGAGRQRSRSIRLGNFELAVPSLKMSTSSRKRSTTFGSRRSRKSTISEEHHQQQQQDSPDQGPPEDPFQSHTGSFRHRDDLQQNNDFSSLSTRRPHGGSQTPDPMERSPSTTDFQQQQQQNQSSQHQPQNPFEST